MYTTIKVSEELKHKMDQMKVNDGESYADVIEDLIEDRLSLNPDFIRDIEKRRKEPTVSLEDLKKEI